MARIKEQEIFVNPYVVQMDKFAESLQHLSKTFLNMEHYKGTLSKEEIDEMFDKVTGNVCAGCERKEVCLGERREKTYQMMYEIMSAASCDSTSISVWHFQTLPDFPLGNAAQACIAFSVFFSIPYSVLHHTLLLHT